ncbi:MAG: hypothetical protein KDC54_09675, partial [Lewinella sp.]|nr:hypothetical protein [Lewinella sp.]
MLAYVLKRIALMLPTLLAITFIAFGLSRLTPGDPVLEDLSVGDVNMSPEVYRREYRKEAERLGYDRPAFYCGLLPLAYPDTLHRIVLPTHRARLKAWIGWSGNWPRVEAFYRSIQSGEQLLWELDGHNDAFINTRYHWGRLYLESEADRLARRLDSVRANVLQDSLLSATFADRLAAAEGAFAQLNTDRTTWKCWVPGWQWYGADNQYHHWLSGMLHGDFGHSLRDQRPVAVRIAEAVRWTLQINGLAIFFAYLLSIPLGVYAAAYVGKRFD